MQLPEGAKNTRMVIKPDKNGVIVYQITGFCIICDGEATGASNVSEFEAAEIFRQNLNEHNSRKSHVPLMDRR